MDYRALVVNENDSGSYEAELKTLCSSDLPVGDVLVRVEYSSLNYKDALSFSGNKGVTRNFPHTPGIDAAGKILSSNDASLKEGEDVLVIGYDLGMNTPGGFGEIISVPKEWVIKLPRELSLSEGMAWGTAGFTAALCVKKLLQNGLAKEQGPVLVSGASGGVGSIATMLLTKLGFEVHALTSKVDDVAFFDAIGASKIVALTDFMDQPARPMLKPIYSSAVDVAGGEVLATMVKCIKYGGSVACCGLVDSIALNTTVLPFILRGINLLGVDSVELPLFEKQTMWNTIATEWCLPGLLGNCQVIKPELLTQSLQLILAGQAKGRFVLKH
ncbi:MAG: YhdH/YhfP family quinone oxidoreductase [Bermanella sp.]